MRTRVRTGQCTVGVVATVCSTVWLAGASSSLFLVAYRAPLSIGRRGERRPASSSLGVRPPRRSRGPALEEAVRRAPEEKKKCGRSRPARPTTQRAKQPPSKEACKKQPPPPPPPPQTSKQLATSSQPPAPKPPASQCGDQVHTGFPVIHYTRY